MRKVLDLIKHTFQEWSRDKASRLAAALAYYTVFSIPPLMVVAIGIAGAFTDRAVVEQQVVAQAGGLMGQQGADAIQTILDSAKEPGNGELVPTLLGVALLIFGASGIFTLAIAILVGVFSGTYSSIFIASPVLALWKEHEPTFKRRRRQQIETQGSVPAFASDLEVARKDDGEAPVIEGGTEEDSPGKPKLSPRDRRRMEREAAKKAGEEA